MTCQDDANWIGKLSLFVGIESAAEHWQISNFLDLANFSKQHGISTLIVKVFEVGSRDGDNRGMWYSWINGGYDALYKALSQQIKVLFYGFLWGSDIAQEAQNINTILSKYGNCCLDMEGGSWVNQVGKAQDLNSRIVNTPGKIWLSLPANPVESGQGDTFKALAPSTNVYMPMAYSDYLTSKAMGDMKWINPNACIMPTLDLSQEFGSNNVLGNAQEFKNWGCPALSLWYQGFAKQDSGLVDRLSKLYGGTVTPVATTTKKWYEYPICVPFGNPNYDSLYGGSHDMDVQTPPNTEITFLLPGTIVDMQEPSWGKQVGVKLDNPYNGIPYMAYLHLSAIHPGLFIGRHCKVGEIVGWSGGCNDQSQYAGTSNPTGQNFTNDPSQSSQPQTGVALMRGPVYGSGDGWENWTGSVDHSSSPLNPTQIILDARSKSTPASPSPFFTEDNLTELWALNVPNIKTGTGIENQWRKDMQAGKWRGNPTHDEVQITWKGQQHTPYLETSGGFYTWENGIAYWHANV